MPLAPPSTSVSRIQAGRADAPAAGPSSGGRPDLAFALLGAVQATVIVAITITTLALPMMQEELGLTRSELVTVSTAYGLAFGGLLLLGGRLADLYGQRRVFMLGLAVFGLASVACGLAPGLLALTVSRFAQGGGAALAAPAALALVGSVFPDPARRARAIAVWGGLGSIGATIGTLLSGLIASWASWRWAFAIPTLIAFVVLVLTPRLLPAGPPPGRARLDVAGAILATAGLSMLSFGLAGAGDVGWTSPRTLVPLALGAALLAAFVAVARTTPEPLVPLSFFASPRRVGALLAVLLTAAGYATTFLLLTLYFQQVRGLSPLASSGAFLPLALVGVATGAVAGRVVGRVGPRATTVAGLLIAAAGLALLSRLDAQAPYVGLLLAGLLVFPLGAGLAFAGATVAAVEGVPDGQAGLAAGVVNAAVEAGPTTVLAVLVSLASSETARLMREGLSSAEATAHGFGVALGVAAAALVVVAGLAAVALRTPPRQPATSRSAPGVEAAPAGRL